MEEQRLRAHRIEDDCWPWSQPSKKQRVTHTSASHCERMCVHLYVSLCLCAGATEAKGIRHPESWGYRILRAAQSVCRELNSGLLQAEPMLFPAPVGSQTRRGGKWRKCLGYRFIKVMAANPIVVQPRFHYRQSEHWEKKNLKQYLQSNELWNKI